MTPSPTPVMKLQTVEGSGQSEQLVPHFHSRAWACLPSTGLRTILMALQKQSKTIHCTTGDGATTRPPDPCSTVFLEHSQLLTQQSFSQCQ
jgi:hypothetical protein